MPSSDKPELTNIQVPRIAKPWDHAFMRIAHEIATKSKDPSTQVGCLIVGGPPGREPKSFGYNGLPRGADDNNVSRYQRPIKYKWFVHAEANAIYNAA